MVGCQHTHLSSKYSNMMTCSRTDMAKDRLPVGHCQRKLKKTGGKMQDRHTHCPVNFVLEVCNKHALNTTQLFLNYQCL